jgi:hypothetical protein
MQSVDFRRTTPDIELFSNLPNPSSHIMATQPLTEMNTRSRKIMRLGSRERKAENLTVICQTIVQSMWEPQHFTNLQDSTACYRDNFTFFTLPCIQ